MRRIKFFSVFIVVFSLFVFGKEAYSTPFAVVANEFERTIQTIDLGTTPPTVHGPFLSGKLGGSGALQDLAVTPDGRFALVGNSELQTVFRIDILFPTNPTLADSLNVGVGSVDGEIDIAISPNGRFALVVGGVSNQMAIIDLATFTLTTTYTVTTPNAGAGCITIAPDNKTVVICDTLNNRIIFGPIDPSSGLTSETTLATGNTPLNATISPDGQTVLVANFVDLVSGAIDHTVSVFRITGPGKIVAGTTPTVSGLPGNQQSIAFSPDGQRAFVVSTQPAPDQLSELLINGPGDVSLGPGVANLLSDAGGGFFGADVLAVTSDGFFALVGNDFQATAPSPDVALVDLSDFTVTSIGTNSNIPAGIDITSAVPPATFPPNVGGGSCSIAGGDVQTEQSAANLLMPLIPAFAIGLRMLRRKRREVKK